MAQRSNDHPQPEAFMTLTPDGLNLVMSLTWRGDGEDWPEDVAGVWCLETLRDWLRHAASLHALRVRAAPDQEMVLLQRTGGAFWEVPLLEPLPAAPLAPLLAETGFDHGGIERCIAAVAVAAPSNGHQPAVEAPIHGLLLRDGEPVPLSNAYAAEVVEVLKERPWSSITDITAALQEQGMDVQDFTVRTRIAELDRAGVLQSDVAPAAGRRKRRVIYALAGSPRG